MGLDTSKTQTLDLSQIYELDLMDGTTVRGRINKHFTRKGNEEWPTLRLFDGRLVGTHISKLRPVEDNNE